MICPKCQELGLNSIVTIRDSFTTLMGFSIHYDKDGNLHSHNPNWITHGAICSNNHVLRIEGRDKCPRAPGDCDWAMEPFVSFIKDNDSKPGEPFRY